MAAILPAAIGVAGGIYKAYQGITDGKEAKRLANAPRPKYDIPQTEYDNLNLLTNRASDGLSGQTKQLYLDNADRGLTTSINSILQGGGNPNDISKLYDNYLGGINNVALENDRQHIGNIDNLINARYRMSGYIDKKWNTNEFAPWADNQRKAAQLKALGRGELDAGINAIGGGLMTGINAVNGKNQANSVNQGGGGGDDGGGGGAETPSGGNQGGGSPSGDSNSPGWYPPMASPSQSGPVASSSASPEWYAPMAAPSNYYGMDVSKMAPNDAQLMNKLLWGQN